MTDNNIEIYNINSDQSELDDYYIITNDNGGDDYTAVKITDIKNYYFNYDTVLVKYKNHNEGYNPREFFQIHGSGYLGRDKVMGKLHRLNGPAAIHVQANSDNTYYFNGEIHRLTGPAVICDVTGAVEYWVFNRQHRLEGPAVILSDGTQYFFIDDHWVTEYEHFIIVNKQ